MLPLDTYQAGRFFATVVPATLRQHPAVVLRELRDEGVMPEASG